MSSSMHRDRNNPGATAVEATKDIAGNAADMAKNATNAAVEKAGEAASYVGKKADDATTAVGGGMKSLADTIREKGPQKGVLGDATSTVANTLESGGRYLTEHGLGGVGEDVTNLIRRNPIPAILIGIGLGYLVARATRG